MGNFQSSPLQQCLNSVCQGRSACVAFPSDPLYQLSWVKAYNKAIHVTPIAVIRPKTADEVAQAINCAVQSKVHVQAKSGGHSYGNYGLGGQDGGLMVDMVNFQQFTLNTTSWQATFGSGYKLGQLDMQLHKSGGRAMAHGTCPGVGAGGHLTIGGIGPSSRMWGTALDHVIEVEVVTADGQIRKASEKENSDLFWALRGAGASFGIITQFTVRTQPEPGHVVEYTYGFNFGRQQDMAAVYESWQKLVNEPQLDRRFSSLFIAQPLGAIITGTFFGTRQEYVATGIPGKIPRGGTLVFKATDWLGSLAHIAEKTGIELSNIPSQFYSKSLALRQQDALTHETVTSLFNYTGSADAGTPLWAVIFDTHGGAISQVADDSTAYPHRDKLIMYQSYVVGLPLREKSRDFAQGIHDIIQKGSPNANTRYAGYVDSMLGRSEAQQTYWGGKLPKLGQIKAKWDPKDVFHNPQSVDPA
ncbi:uncharacterized protein UV8b_03339 [Ustilaginoidea virens]|uniref:FAD-binding PCMH-type domain-containing protein n=1 Tax=Ustilaginoidea virens TaxID=1159556 RepID=A0A063BLK6_USTVR|nr:uncharacterized protein UV8b_03339 [Ustilaginoidea virens]QUC19098.1 hypothetical protein UV8b_03339 [Ustilaginoidea virens]GAO19283.1 hypothetical protein UVI_02063390 [Ustilaginoidea virens]